MSIACSSDSTQDFLRRLAALFQSIRWNRIRVRLSWIRAMFGCNAKSLPLPQGTSVLAGMSFVPA
jgi:hypothetical protein